ncbi:unnamed protein product [Paramecium sonneborni]|uniref:Uncharacterized protein n=1 Tax=Paramecium sonneborni TaxID=65129 RepID=A0A8S1KH55_9CILI|nr:unnamed protein product [Paramecium sonneborni]
MQYEPGLSSSLLEFIKIRETSISKNQQNIQSIYNQQTLNVHKSWAQVICTHKRENQQADLIPPFNQIVQSVLNLYPCVDNYFLQLELIEILIKVQQGCIGLTKICQMIFLEC